VFITTRPQAEIIIIKTKEYNNAPECIIKFTVRVLHTARGEIGRQSQRREEGGTFRGRSKMTAD
jgi:hypothetical protein